MDITLTLNDRRGEIGWSHVLNVVESIDQYMKTFNVIHSFILVIWKLFYSSSDNCHQIWIGFSPRSSVSSGSPGDKIGVAWIKYHAWLEGVQEILPSKGIPPSPGKLPKRLPVCLKIKLSTKNNLNSFVYFETWHNPGLLTRPKVIHSDLSKIIQNIQWPSKTHVAYRKHRKTCASMSLKVLGLLLTGWQSGAMDGWTEWCLSLCVAMQNKNKWKLLPTHTDKWNLWWFCF